MLKSITGSRVGFLDVSRAYDKACEYGESCLEKWKEVYERESRGRKDLHVVLLGRPYTIFSRFMNKGIPDIFASLGIRVFFQDMLSCSG
jgi:predicted nucleotide-binding protein (sugar kinase/HSP70/actin superfamily)